MRFVIILFSYLCLTQPLAAQLIFKNGRLLPSTVDTIKQIGDTLWIKTTCCEKNNAKYISFLKGSTYSKIRRDYYTLPWIHTRIFPKSRYREEGILIKNSKTITKGEVMDSIVYSTHGSRDSITDGASKLIWKRDPEHFSIGPCVNAIFVLKKTFLREERKKKRAKQRKK